MMPASRPCSSTTASVIRLYLSNSAATSSSRRVGRAGDVRLAQLATAATAGDEIAILTSGTAPTSLWPGAGQIDRRQRFAAAFERLQRVDRIVDDAGFGDGDELGGHAAGGGVLAELEELRDLPPLLGLPSP